MNPNAANRPLFAQLNNRTSESFATSNNQENSSSTFISLIFRQKLLFCILKKNIIKIQNYKIAFLPKINEISSKKWW